MRKNKENDLKINEFLKKDQKENDSYKKKKTGRVDSTDV